RGALGHFLGFPQPCALPRPHRCRDRRRICRHQFGNQRADAGAAARPARPHHQWQLLAGGRPGRGGGPGPAGPRPAAPPGRLAPALLPINVGWRLGFGIGAALGTAILLLRRLVPESPRWLLTHGHGAAADAAVAEIEARVVRATGQTLPPAEGTLTIHPRPSF